MYQPYVSSLNISNTRLEPNSIISESDYPLLKCLILSNFCATGLDPDFQIASKGGFFEHYSIAIYENSGILGTSRFVLDSDFRIHNRGG